MGRGLKSPRRLPKPLVRLNEDWRAHYLMRGVPAPRDDSGFEPLLPTRLRSNFVAGHG
jgi:hypothetical protein